MSEPFDGSGQPEPAADLPEVFIPKVDTVGDIFDALQGRRTRDRRAHSHDQANVDARPGGPDAALADSVAAPLDPAFDQEPFDTAMDGAGLIAALFAHANEENALPMAAYMRNKFPFLGLKAGQRRAVTKAFFTTAKSDPRPDWSFISICWAYPHREFQYVAADYLQLMNRKLGPEDLPRIRTLVEAKSWWDTVDMFHKTVGKIVARHPEEKQTMHSWAKADNLWTRRIAINHQQAMKAETDTDLLAEIILLNVGEAVAQYSSDDVFFIEKAIGWSLREFSKTNPDWVREFISVHDGELAPLSVREASKYL